VSGDTFTFNFDTRWIGLCDGPAALTSGEELPVLLEYEAKLVPVSVENNVAPNFLYSCSDLCRKFLHDLTTARHFIKSFVICIIRIFTMKIGKFQLRDNNSVCARTFRVLRDRAPAQLRGNICSDALQKRQISFTCQESNPNSLAI
jgi:hypothetical protein